jgi:hypothetical protein
MRGLPKFLLPCDEYYTTLIERHITQMLNVCETVWIPTRPEQTILLESLGLSSDRVVIVPMSTQTMTQTIIRLCAISGAERFMMVMPDTYFSGEQPYEYLANSTSEMDLACWPIRQEQLGKLGQVLIQDLPEGAVLDSRDKDPNCKWPQSWGAMAFNRGALSFAMTDMPHTGYIIPKLLESRLEVRARVLEGIYFDCGTPREYLQMLELLT